MYTLYTGSGTLLRMRQTNASETYSMGHIISHDWPFHYICVIKFCLLKFCYQTTCTGRGIVMLRYPDWKMSTYERHNKISKIIISQTLYRAAFTLQLRICIILRLSHACSLISPARSLSARQLYRNLSLINLLSLAGS